MSAYLISLSGPHRLRLVEVAVEVDLVADFHAGRHVPGVFGVGEYLAPYEGVNATVLKQWYLLGIPQFWVWFVLDDRGSAG